MRVAVMPTTIPLSSINAWPIRRERCRDPENRETPRQLDGRSQRGVFVATAFPPAGQDDPLWKGTSAQYLVFRADIRRRSRALLHRQSGYGWFRFRLLAVALTMRTHQAAQSNVHGHKYIVPVAPVPLKPNNGHQGSYHPVP